MKHRYLAIICLLLVLAVTACAERESTPAPAKTSQLVLLNPGFEMAGGDNVIPHWNTAQHAGDPAYEMTMDTSVAAEGKQSFRLTQQLPEAYGMVEQHMDATPDMVGKIARMTAKVKTENVGPKGWTLLLVVTDGTDYDMETYTSAPVIGTTDWQQVELSGKVLPMTTRITVGAYFADTGNGGVAWLDDVKIDIIDDRSTAKL